MSKVLIISSVYPPDPAAVGQYLEDVAVELARQGNEVTVFTPTRGYDDPSIEYPRREMRKGVRVHRLPLGSFGKATLLHRALGGLLFIVQATLKGLLLRGSYRVLITTAPPVGMAGALVLRLIRGAQIIYWVMDINPDQAIALGRIGARSVPARVLERMFRAALRLSKSIIVLDRFMAQRVLARGPSENKISVIPPWPLPVERGVNAGDEFRRRNGWEGKTVIMYSGNHSPSNPLDTLLRVAQQFRDDDRLVFAFVGGGVGKRAVEAIKGGNIVSLPYQDLSAIGESLSAADVHVVVLGPKMGGIVHPSKLYTAMAIERPVLVIGPRESYAGDIVCNRPVGWIVEHDDDAGLASVIRSIADSDRSSLREKGRAASAVIAESFAGEMLKKRVCSIVTDNG